MGDLKRIGVLTGGGDCPGMNAVIRTVTREACRAGAEVVGVLDGFLGLIETPARTRTLTPADVRGLLSVGGTVLGTSNRADPFHFAVPTVPQVGVPQVGRSGPTCADAHETPGQPVMTDVSDRCLAALAALRLDALIIAGGDGTMTIAAELEKRLSTQHSALSTRILGIPKTIDNDLCGTALSFGFLTAVSIATEALDRVRTTAASHHRVMAVEVMGRNSGWIALHAGVAGGADAILIPEIPFDFGPLVEAIRQRKAAGKHHSVLCIAEGARPAGGGKIVARVDPTSPDPIRLGGVGRFVAEEIEKRAGIESRYVVLGHTQRGGPPVPEDRILGTLFAHHALKLAAAGASGRMVAMKSLAAGAAGLTDVPLSEAAGKQRLVPVGKSEEHPLVEAARAVGTCFGDT